MPLGQGRTIGWLFVAAKRSVQAVEMIMPAERCITHACIGQEVVSLHRGTFWGVPIRRFIVLWGLFRAFDRSDASHKGAP